MKIIGLPKEYYRTRCDRCGAIDKIAFNDCKYCKERGSMTYSYKYWQLNYG